VPPTTGPRTGTGRGNGGGIGAPFVTPGPPVVPVGVVLPDRQPLGPVAADGSSVFARGSGVPIIFRAYGDDGLAIGAAGFVKDVVLVTSAALPASASVTEGYFLAFPFVYADAPDVWLGSIPTADLEGGERYTYRVELADGSIFTVTFGVR
jgi:hypothetical protein